MQETKVESLGQEDPLEKETATLSNILAWEIPQTEESGGLQSMGLQKCWICLSNYTTTAAAPLYHWPDFYSIYSFAFHRTS